MFLVASVMVDPFQKVFNVPYADPSEESLPVVGIPYEMYLLNKS